jgi:hypothetical protein
LGGKVTGLKLHDATLIRIESDLERGLGRIEFRTESGEKTVVCEGVVEVSYAPRLPWGMSVSVNDATVEPLGELKRLRIEMQSGDPIELLASRIYLLK